MMRQLQIFVLCCAAVAVSAKHVRITNNEKAVPGEFPYMISLQIDGRHYCGGALISKQHVLTAAHCVHDFILQRMDKSRIKIAVGTTTVPGGTIHEVDRIAHHGSYQPIEVHPTMTADVAVIRLKKPITESANVKPIGLPTAGQEYVQGQQFIVSGFGASVLNGPTSPVLKKLNMVATAKTTCQQYWQNSLDGGHICAAGSGAGICQGDSGGPLTVNKQTVIGIVSATSGYGCGIGIPDLFTKVSAYMDFINSEVAMTS